MKISTIKFIVIFSLILALFLNTHVSLSLNFSTIIKDDELIILLTFEDKLPVKIKEEIINYELNINIDIKKSLGNILLKIIKETESTSQAHSFNSFINRTLNRKFYVEESYYAYEINGVMIFNATLKVRVNMTSKQTTGYIDSYIHEVLGEELTIPYECIKYSNIRTEVKGNYKHLKGNILLDEKCINKVISYKERGINFFMERIAHTLIIKDGMSYMNMSTYFNINGDLINYLLLSLSNLNFTKSVTLPNTTLVLGIIKVLEDINSVNTSVVYNRSFEVLRESVLLRKKLINNLTRTWPAIRELIAGILINLNIHDLEVFDIVLATKYNYGLNVDSVITNSISHTNISSTEALEVLDRISIVVTPKQPVTEITPTEPPTDEVESESPAVIPNFEEYKQRLMFFILSIFILTVLIFLLLLKGAETSIRVN